MELNPGKLRDSKALCGYSDHVSVTDYVIMSYVGVLCIVLLICYISIIIFYIYTHTHTHTHTNSSKHTVPQFSLYEYCLPFSPDFQIFILAVWQIFIL